MINFFESDLNLQNQDKKQYKAIAIGVGVLSSIGIGIKTGSVVDMFYNDYERLTSPKYKDFLLKMLNSTGVENMYKDYATALKQFNNGDVVSAVQTLNWLNLPSDGHVYGFNDTFGRFGLMLKRIPVIGSITKYLDEVA